MAYLRGLSEMDIQNLELDLDKKLGVKGSDVYTEKGVGDMRVTFFTQLVRGLSNEEIERNINSIIKTHPIDAVVMAFQTRDIRGGKGERGLFYKMLLCILKNKPEWSEKLMELVPEYGCWRDMWVLYVRGSEEVQKAIDAVVLNQFQLDQESEHPSLLVKWLPREGSKYDKLANHFANLLFPLTPESGGQRLRIYRKTLSYLNKKIDTTEVKMCGKVWATINPSHVPGRLMKRCKGAFLNENKEEEDRKKCVENFKAFLEDVKDGNVKMKGANVIMPHELVSECLNMTLMTPKEEIEIVEQQWKSIREKAKEAGGLGKIIPMCDFSGSMNGNPKKVSLALGILISEVVENEAFKDMILTFDENPKIYSFSKCKTLRDKVNSVRNFGQGLNTDFQKACDLILKRLVECEVKPEDAPTDLLVLTDMGFDQAYQSGHYNVKRVVWQTHFDMIRSNFEKYGYKPPRIVCWNLRAEYKDYHATAHTDGVVQLSGWSPSVLKAIQKNGIKLNNPYEGMRSILDDSRYDRVREVMGLFGAKDILYSA
jgi:hypothetical protein